MFGAVAPVYDLLNHLLSGSLDRVWRRRAARALDPRGALPLFDGCAGTADQAIAARRHGRRIAAGDFCLPMLGRARRKLRRRGLADVHLLAADALELPFGDRTFGGATVSFGLRNVADLDRSLRELARVLAPGAPLVVLEFALPRLAPLRWIYLLYFTRILPLVGRWISRHGSAYDYLPGSVLEFPQRREFTNAMEATGFDATAWSDLTGGIVCLYRGERAGEPSPATDDPRGAG